MKAIYISAILASSLTINVMAEALPQTGSGETDGYKVVWQDLFDNGVLNTDVWTIEVNGSGGGNNELQYYTDNEANVRVGDDGDGNGCLILTAIREDYKNKKFTSGRLNTLEKVAFTHGKIEASIKLPKTTNGLWPAFWMMGNDYNKVGWPRCGEIDIVEMGHANGIQNGTQDRYFNGACHWGPQWPNASYANSTTKSYSLQDGEYHLYTLIWDENKVKMYVDLDRIPVQNPYFSMDIKANEPDNDWSAGNYFHKPNFILFDLAVGGDFTGIHDAAKITALNDENNQSASMYVNFVKIYQKGDANETLMAPDEGTNGIRCTEADNDTDILFDGQSVSNSRNKPLTLTSIAGNRIATSVSGTISTADIAAGIYIATAGSSSKKIIIR